MFINIHTHQLAIDQHNKLEIYNQYPWNLIENNAYHSIGIHPVFIHQSSIDKDLETIKHQIQQEKCIAIGEIGLDKLTDVDFELQQNVFRLQLEIAQQHQIPVIIHCVRAYQEIFQIRKQMKITIPFIFHGFNKNQHLLKQIIDNNCIPSFGKNLLQNPNLQTIFANLFDKPFLLENDGSQIPIEEIYLKAAEIKNCSIEELQDTIQNYFYRIFKQNNE